MFTMRFENHHGGYTVMSCASYSVGCIGSTETGLAYEVRMYRSRTDDNPYYEQIGDTHPYGTVYVSNANGKTVDTIRSPSPADQRPQLVG